MLELSSVFLRAVLMDRTLPFLECSLVFPPKSLYRTARGRRVVCDLEGYWHCQVFGRPPDDLAVAAEDCLLITTKSLSEDWGWAALRCRPEPALTFDGLGDSAAGQGWVRAEDCTLELNNDLHPVKIPIAFGPVILPFWNGFLADKALQYVSLNSKMVELASFIPPTGEGSLEVNFKVQRASQVVVLEAGNGRGEIISAPVFSHLNRASFTLALPADTDTLVLQRRFDAFHGLQRARVFFDDAFMGWWHSPRQNRVNRWAVDSCHFKARPEQRDKTIRITLDPPAGVPLFSLSQIQVFAITQ